MATITVKINPKDGKNWVVAITAKRTLFIQKCPAEFQQSEDDALINAGHGSECEEEIKEVWREERKDFLKGFASKGDIIKDWID